MCIKPVSPFFSLSMGMRFQELYSQHEVRISFEKRMKTQRNLAMIKTDICVKETSAGFGCTTVRQASKRRAESSRSKRRPLQCPRRRFTRMGYGTYLLSGAEQRRQLATSPRYYARRVATIEEIAFRFVTSRLQFSSADFFSPAKF